jgi:predicted carbohydrate-binding protein with CBM5 and CBM33 domain/chitodextrinase
MKTQFTLCTLAVSAVLCALPTQTVAHGYMDSPKARQAICQEQGGFWWPEDGTGIANLACRAAFLESGHVQFIQRHEFAVNTANYRDINAVKANIPDGQLCGAGDKQKRGMNVASSEWQRSEVRPDGNGNIKVRFRATTPHNPSFWQFYLTKPGTAINDKALAWDDLVLVQEHANTPFFMAPDGKRYYEMNVAIPAGTSGDAILYTRWQRDDVVGEGFYNCSDITIVNEDAHVPDTWFSAGQFVKNGQQPAIGDTVWFRLFNEDGKELVQTSLVISDSNHANWIATFANQLMQAHFDLLAIGVKGSEGNIALDTRTPMNNQVYVSNANYTVNLSVVAKPTNTAPHIHTPSAIVMDENTSTQVHVHAFDDEQSNLTFNWQLPANIKVLGSGATVTFRAGEVNSDTTVKGLVTVSDGQLSTSAPLTITIKNITPPTPEPTPEPTPGNTWQRDKVYVAGNEVVHQGVTYRAKWWTRSEEPGKAQVWERVSKGSEQPSDEWQHSKAYQGGAVVSFQGKKYQARWWTQGQVPGQANVWKLI